MVFMNKIYAKINLFLVSWNIYIANLNALEMFCREKKNVSLTDDKIFKNNHIFFYTTSIISKLDLIFSLVFLSTLIIVLKNC